MDREELEKDFLQVNRDLLRGIEQALLSVERRNNSELIPRWKHPSVWKEVVLPYLNSLIENYADSNITILAGFQVGLAKYMDFFFLGWATQEEQKILKSQVARIVQLALQLLPNHIINFQQPCQKMHDDGACKTLPLSSRYISIRGDLYHRGWPILPAVEAANFLRQPQPTPEILKPEEHLYRIIGPENNPYGCWWFSDPFPQNKRDWRAMLAILERWNSDDWYVDFIIRNPIKVWVGKAASQLATKNCILPGGGVQIWIAPDIIQQICLSVSQSPPPWRK